MSGYLNFLIMEKIWSTPFETEIVVDEQKGDVCLSMVVLNRLKSILHMKFEAETSTAEK